MAFVVLPKIGSSPILPTDINMFPWGKLSLILILFLVVFLKAQFSAPLLFLVDINDLSNCSEILDFHLYADDANLFYKRKNLKVLESKVNNELVNIHTWLTFVIFHPPRRKLPFHIILSLNSINLNQEYSEKISKYCNIF